MAKCLVVNVCANTVSVACIVILPWTCDTWIMCSHVCVWVSADRNEGHPDDLDIWEWRRLKEIYQILVFFLFVFCVCMYEEYLHSLTSSLSCGQILVEHVHPSSSPPCLLLMNIHLTARAFTKLLSSKHYLPPLLCGFGGPSPVLWCQLWWKCKGQAWSTVTVLWLLGVSYISFFILSPKRSKNGEPPCYFPAVTFDCLQNCSYMPQGTILISFFFMYSLTFFIPGINKWLKWK